MKIEARRWIALFTLLLFGTFGASLLAIRRGDSIKKGEIPVRISPTGTPSIQQARTDAHVEEVTGEEFRELVKHLQRPEEYMNIGMTGNPSAIMPDEQFEQCLASRRTRRLVEILAKQTATEARDQCEQIFEQMLTLHLQNLRKGAGQLRAGKLLSANDPEVRKAAEERAPTLSSQIAGVASAVFLSAHYCDAATVQGQLLRWSRDVAACGDDIQSVPAEYREYVRIIVDMAKPERRFQLNIYLFMASRTIAEHSPQATSLAEVIAKLDRHTVPVVGWDARIGSFDFVHRHQMAPVDTSRGVTSYDVWNWRPHCARDSVVQESLVKDVAALLMNASQPK